MRGNEWWIVLVIILFVAELIGSIIKAQKKAQQRQSGFPDRRPQPLDEHEPAPPRPEPSRSLEEWLRRLERGSEPEAPPEPRPSPPPPPRIRRARLPEPEPIVVVAAGEEPPRGSAERAKARAAPRRPAAAGPAPAGRLRRSATATELLSLLRKGHIRSLFLASEIFGPPRSFR